MKHAAGDIGVSVWVPGRPATKGSWRHVGKGRFAPDNKCLRGWSKRVAAAVARQWDAPPAASSIELSIVYFLKRPKSHYGTGRNAHRLERNAPSEPHVLPDGDKMERAIFDALTGVVYVDDRQVTRWSGCKRYVHPDYDVGSGEGALIRITVIEDNNEDR